MIHQRFGGQWTDKKLECLRRYLMSYMRIMKGNERARFFTTNYVDAFAGSGYISNKNEESGEDIPLPGLEEDQNGESLKKGSPCIALEIDPPFDKYIFIEKNPKNIIELSSLKTQYPNRNIDIIQGDANKFLAQWCSDTDWVRNRAVVFLDPFGMQIDWPLLECIAKTKSIDLWLLVPLGVGLVRMLTKKDLPNSEWAEKITMFLGTDEWKKVLYETKNAPTLFGVEECISRVEDFMKIGDYVIDRLKSIFFAVSSRPLVLLNSKNNPIYLFVFAAGNEKGSKPAISIADYLINQMNN